MKAFFCRPIHHQAEAILRKDVGNFAMPRLAILISSRCTSIMHPCPFHSLRTWASCQTSDTYPLYILRLWEKQIKRYLKGKLAPGNWPSSLFRPSHLWSWLPIDKHPSLLKDFKASHTQLTCSTSLFSNDSSQSLLLVTFHAAS